MKLNYRVNHINVTISSCFLYIEKNLIKEVSIFDIFVGKNIEEGKKSVALRVKIQHQEKTMSSEEIDAISNKLIDAITKSFSATLRK